MSRVDRNKESSKAPSTDVRLPAGEKAPSGSLVKLVLASLLAALVLVAFWLIFGWLALAPGDADSLVDSLSQDGRSRWRAAVDLARLLRQPGSAALKRDPALLRRIAAILDNEIDAGLVHRDQITLRVYLCRALGEFHIADGLPTLLKAVRTQRDERAADVRRSAIEAIAVLAANVGPGELRADPEVVPVVLEATEDEHATVRSAAAFALGVIGSPEAEAGLEKMLDDEHPDVRYNAAIGLARQGNAKTVDTLLEMLDPDQLAGVAVEEQEPARPFKRTMILVNALRATRLLASANTTVDLDRLAEAVRRLARGNVEQAVRLQAAEVLNELDDRAKK